MTHVPIHGSDLTIGQLWLEQVRRSSNRIAIELGVRAITYLELNALVNSFAGMLLDKGIRRHDRIAILSWNSIEYVALQLAAAKLGVAVACLNWRQAFTELEYCAELAGPKLIFASSAYLNESAQIAKKLGIGTISMDQPLPQEFTEADEPRANLAEVEAEDIWSILYTSGTTGWPKGAAISHRAMIARMAISLLDGGVIPDLPSVTWAPMFHMSGTDNTLIALLAGSGVILFDKYDSNALATLAVERELGVLPLMPSTISPLIQSVRELQQPIRGIARIGSMADLIPPDQIAEISRLLNAPFRNTFGSTETGQAPASKGIIPPGLVPSTLSKMQSSLCAIRLVDDDGNEVPDGMPGEVAMRGPSLFSGYVTKSDIDRIPVASGWFLTGDVMRHVGGGLFDFVDRKKYLIKSGGENIYPAEIERILLAYERISDAVVVRDQHPEWGECPVAFVVPRAIDVTAEEIKSLFAGKLSKYKHPKRIIFITEENLPRNTTGKIQRHILEARLKTEPAV
jgi:fatty-acyl-CoA synthase